MSWLVQSYIINSDTIKTSCTMDSDEYLDLLVIEMMINKLYDNGLLTEREKSVVDLLSSGYTFGDAGKKLNLLGITVSSIFNSVCQKVAFILGGYYTDIGYLNYIKNKYNFTDEIMEKINNYIHSNSRHKVKRTNFLLLGEGIINDERTKMYP